MWLVWANIFPYFSHILFCLWVVQGEFYIVFCILKTKWYMISKISLWFSRISLSKSVLWCAQQNLVWCTFVKSHLKCPQNSWPELLNEPKQKYHWNKNLALISLPFNISEFFLSCRPFLPNKTNGSCFSKNNSCDIFLRNRLELKPVDLLKFFLRDLLTASNMIRIFINKELLKQCYIKE